MIKLLLWLVPLSVVPASYVVYRYCPLRKARYYFYAVVLIAAFFLNLFRISFWNELFDTVEFVSINFICAEFFWNLLRVKSRKLFRVFLVMALCLFGIGLKRWIVAGPNHARELWKPCTASTYHRGSDNYAVREHELFTIFHPARLLVLSKQMGILPFEKQIGSYRTPKGYGYADFTYKWSETSQGVRLDLHTAGYRLWTMGEGF
jgi:hypothetical protein